MARGRSASGGGLGRGPSALPPRGTGEGGDRAASRHRSNTVDRLLARREPPRYVRAPAGSQLDPFAERIAELLAADPTARATVIRERLQADGYRGGITILKDHLAKVRARVPPGPGR